jgi:hypothetical protein
MTTDECTHAAELGTASPHQPTGMDNKQTRFGLLNSRMVGHPETGRYQSCVELPAIASSGKLLLAHLGPSQTKSKTGINSSHAVD